MAGRERSERGRVGRFRRPARRTAGATATIAIGTAALALFSAACDPGFDDESEVKDLRVLAVEADPPEFLFDVQEIIMAGTIPTPPPSRLRPLVVNPLGHPLLVSALACPNDPAEAVTGGAGPGGPRGTVSRGAICNPGTSDVLLQEQPLPDDGIAVDFVPSTALLRRAWDSDPYTKVFGGPVLGLPIDVEWTVRSADGSEALEVVKRVLYDPKLTPDQVPNKNPQITGLQTWTVRGGPREPLGPDDVRTVKLGGEITIDPAVPDLDAALAQRESYPAIVLDRTTNRPALRNDPPRVEVLRYSYFTSRGRMQPQLTDSRKNPLVTDEILHLESKYVAPKELPPGADPMVTIWIVVRDERGGASYAVRKLRLE